MSFDDDIQEGFPALERIGEYVEQPKYIIFFDRPNSKTFALKEVPKQITNELFHYLMMRETGCSAVEAAYACIKNKEALVIRQVGSPIEYVSSYLVLH